MRVVTWNCNGAFRLKAEALASLSPDICVIQECEDPAKLDNQECPDWRRNYLWTGSNSNRGLAVFASPSITLERLDWASGELQHFLPVRVNGQFNLLGVWTTKGTKQRHGYIRQLWDYLQINGSQLERIESLVAGDLNSNKIWDKKRRIGNHSDVVAALQQKNIMSLYHQWYLADQGKEQHPTFFLYRNVERPYHIDYIFGSALFEKSLVDIRVLPRKGWLELSDHLPLVAEFSLDDESESNCVI